MQLYVMTGDFMTGKTTWIMHMLDAASELPVAPRIAGVVSPAVFADGKKTGIDALLLPGREHFELARPRTGTFVDERHEHHGDTASNPIRGSERSSESSAPANPAKLGWAFSDAAMQRINEHLAGPACSNSDLLVVDELGPLELLHGGGYTEALRLLDAGSPRAALVVIRPALLDVAHERWGSFKQLSPASNIATFLSAI